MIFLLFWAIALVIFSAFGAVISGAVLRPLLARSMAARHGWRKIEPHPHHAKRNDKAAGYFKAFSPQLVLEARLEADKRGLPLRVMFQDEARFGRINDPRKCWAPKGVRPDVCSQIVREYTYLYGAFSPQDGQCDFLILHAMDGACMNVFLKEVSARYQSEFLYI